MKAIGIFEWGVRFRCFFFMLGIGIAWATTVHAGDWRHPDARFLLVDEALSQDDFALAQKQLAELRTDAKRAKDPAFVGEIGERSKEVARIAREFDKISKSWNVLSSGRRDKKASVVVGSFFAEVIGDWDKALPHLAAGDVEDLAEAAARDRPEASHPEEQFRIADRWWHYGLSIGDAARRGVYQLRARAWMLKARLGVEEEQRTIIDQRLRQIPLFPEAIVVWNTHNGQSNDRGAEELVISLSYQGKAVWKKATPIVWRPNEPAYILVRPPRVRADRVHVDISRSHNTRPGLGEIEVIVAGNNIARNCRPMASSLWEFNEQFRVANLLDGDPTGNSGYWLASDGPTAWAAVHLIELNSEK